MYSEHISIPYTKQWCS